MTSEVFTGVIMKVVIFRGLTLCSQSGRSERECLLPDCTVLHPRGQQSSKKDNTRWGGEQHANFKFTHAHVLCVYAVSCVTYII